MGTGGSEGQGFERRGGKGNGVSGRFIVNPRSFDSTFPPKNLLPGFSRFHGPCLNKPGAGYGSNRFLATAWNARNCCALRNAPPALMAPWAQAGPTMTARPHRPLARPSWLPEYGCYPWKQGQCEVLRVRP